MEPSPDAPAVVAPACEKPCSSCPWLTSNHGKPHPDGWYTLANRKRLWAKMRRGERMSCHMTDPRNPVPEGVKPVPEHAVTRECTGGLILQQREVMRLQAPSGPFKQWDVYHRDHPRGLTKMGAFAMVDRAMFAGSFYRPMTKPDLNEPVSHLPLGDWSKWVDEHPRKEKMGRKSHSNRTQKRQRKKKTREKRDSKKPNKKEGA